MLFEGVDPAQEFGDWVRQLPRRWNPNSTNWSNELEEISPPSIAARQPVDGLMLSNSLRAAVMAFARTLANETAADGVTVNNLMPGYTKTDRVIDLSTQVAARDGVAVSDVYARWEREIPMRRLGEPREFGALAAFLASDLASYITGQSIAVDGGWIKGL